MLALSDCGCKVTENIQKIFFLLRANKKPQLVGLFLQILILSTGRFPLYIPLKGTWGMAYQLSSAMAPAYTLLGTNSR